MVLIGSVSVQNRQSWREYVVQCLEKLQFYTNDFKTKRKYTYICLFESYHFKIIFITNNQVPWVPATTLMEQSFTITLIFDFCSYPNYSLQTHYCNIHYRLISIVACYTCALFYLFFFGGGLNFYEKDFRSKRSVSIWRNIPT